MATCTRCKRHIVIAHLYGDNERLCAPCFEQAVTGTSSQTLVQQLTEELLAQTERSQQLTEHSQRLEELVRKMAAFFSEVPDLDIAYCDSQKWKTERDTLLLRAHQLVPEKPFKEPLEGVSGM